MQAIKQQISDVKKLVFKPHGDERGTFYKVFGQKEFDGITQNQIVQINHSINTHKYTLRGMHLQLPPFDEEKIILCLNGAIQDVFIDLRKSSPTFKKWESAVLKKEQYEALYLPKGIAHGFLTLVDNTELLYLHTNHYNKNSERGIAYNDPELNIDWISKPSIISERDKKHPCLAEFIKEENYEM